MWSFMNYKDNCDETMMNFFNSMNEGFAVHKIICDYLGKPIDYIYLEVNDAFVEITNLKKEKIIDKKVTELYPDIDNKWIETYGKVALTGERIQFESYFASLDKHFRISVFSPSIGIFITFFYDITELVKANEILKQHQILFENALDIILYIKLDGSIINANKSALTKYGYSLEEFTKMKIQDIRHPSTMITFIDEMKASDSIGITFESIHIKKDGTAFPVEVSVKSVIESEYGTRLHIIRDITERKKAEERMNYLANYDGLTGIANRSHLMRHLDMLIERAKRGKEKFALMLFDIDKFKMINDTYGHAVGDKVLKNVAKEANSSIRKTDFIARLGGDEFIIVQTFLKYDKDACILASKILKGFEKPMKVNGFELKISLSIGISIFPENATGRDKLINYADKAMYLAKQSGGDRYLLYSDFVSNKS
ncbi:MAG: sensor domain-containing diguanylate cyclase [Firmicutes bacterium]|nr:sensor domain-containing diguanylate cyclase [Bacillota bacterium]